MKILGVSASSRAWGNTDILVRHALRGAATVGAETRFLRLSDLELKNCTGCMSCVLKDRDCVLKDGLPEILAALRWADAVALGSPTYILGTAAGVKVLQERLLRYATTAREFVGKPGLALAAAGIRDSEPFVLPQLSLTFLSLGMPVIDQFIGYGQGPGEVFWDPDALARAVEGGAALGRGESAYRGGPGACPSCHFDLVTVDADGSGRCRLCDLPGHWQREDGPQSFRSTPGAEPRWSEGRVRDHFQEKLLPSGPRFRSRRDEIRRRVDALKREATAEGEPP